MNLDRFKPPGPNDDMADCQECGARMRYDLLDEDGLCDTCQNNHREDDNDRE